MRNAAVWAFVGFAIAAGCRKDGAPEPAAKSDRHRGSTEASIEWIHDDYAASLAEARRRELPLVVDFWAAWCHTCLSMQQTVLIDPGLADLAQRFVWVALDTENPVNVPALETMPVEVWPTFYVVDAKSEVIQATQRGATSVEGFREFLERGERGVVAASDETAALPAGSALYHLRAGDRAAAAGNFEGADAAYGAALARGGEDWARAPGALLAQISTRLRAGDVEGCARLGISELDRVAAARSATATDFSAVAHACAREASEDQAAAIRSAATPVLESLVTSDDSLMSIDDRSDALRQLREFAEADGDHRRALAYARKQRELLDDAVAAAKTPDERMTYCAHRADVYAALGIGEELIPWIQDLVDALPEEYDPPYRLATLLVHLERWDEALAAAQTARERATGRRKGLILSLIADIHARRGDVVSARRTLGTLVFFYARQPSTYSDLRALEATHRRLTDLEGR